MIDYRQCRDLNDYYEQYGRLLFNFEELLPKNKILNECVICGKKELLLMEYKIICRACKYVLKFKKYP